MLIEDHRLVDGYFQKVEANEDGNNRDVFNKIKIELDTHAHIEEAIFYPHLLENGDKELQKIVREGLEEHGQAKQLLVEIDELRSDSETFKAKLKVLIENIRHHVSEEEGEMFPMVEDQIDSAAKKRLAERMQKEKEAFKKRALARARPSARRAAARG